MGWVSSTGTLWVEAPTGFSSRGVETGPVGGVLVNRMGEVLRPNLKVLQ